MGKGDHKAFFSSSSAAAFSASNWAAPAPPPPEPPLTPPYPQPPSNSLLKMLLQAADCCVCSLRSVQRNLRVQPAEPEELNPDPGHGLLSRRQVSLIINDPVLRRALGVLDPSA